ncbi:MAG: hypothetical protein V3T17_00580 [Pseudomonadales bacterium]
MISPIPQIQAEIADAFDSDVRESLTIAHAAFLDALNGGRLGPGKARAVDALFVCPHQTTWVLFALLHGLEDESNGPATTMLVMSEWLDFVALPHMARDLALAQIGFRNRYETADGFLEQLSERTELGLTDAGWVILREHPKLFVGIGNQVVQYATHVNECGDTSQGELLEILGVTIRDSIQEPG